MLCRMPEYFSLPPPFSSSPFPLSPENRWFVLCTWESEKQHFRITERAPPLSFLIKAVQVPSFPMANHLQNWR